MLQTPLGRTIRVIYLVSCLILGATYLPKNTIATESPEWPPASRIAQNSEPRETNACNPEAIATEPSLMALLPPDQEEILTVKGLPSFFFYLPETSAQNAEFVLSDNRNRLIYKVRFAITGNPGLIRLQLPVFINLKPLEFQNIYRWSFSVICNPSTPSQNLTRTGTLQRLPFSYNLARQLERSSPSNHAQIYAEAGLWMDALNSLAHVSQLPLEDGSNQQEWETLLRSMGLEELELGTFLRF